MRSARKPPSATPILGIVASGEDPRLPHQPAWRSSARAAQVRGLETVGGGGLRRASLHPSRMRRPHAGHALHISGRPLPTEAKRAPPDSDGYKHILTLRAVSNPEETRPGGGYASPWSPVWADEKGRFGAIRRKRSAAPSRKPSHLTRPRTRRKPGRGEGINMMMKARWEMMTTARRYTMKTAWRRPGEPEYMAVWKVVRTARSSCT